MPDFHKIRSYVQWTNLAAWTAASCRGCWSLQAFWTIISSELKLAMRALSVSSSVSVEEMSPAETFRRFWRDSSRLFFRNSTVTWNYSSVIFVWGGNILSPRPQTPVKHYLTVDVPITLIHISLRPWPLIPPYRSPSSLTSLRRLRISSWSLPLFLKLAIRAPEPALGGSDILTRTERSPRHSADPRRSYEYSISNVTAWTEYAVRRITQSALDSAQRRSATWFHTDGDDGYMLKDRGRRSGDKGFSNEALTRFSLK